MNLSYNEFIRRQSLDAKNGIKPEIGQFVIDNKVKTLFEYFPFCYYLLDYGTQKFEFMNNSENVLGYSMDEFTIKGLPGSLKNLHPDDYKIFSEKLFPEILKFFSEIHPNDRNEYRISYNYRYKKKDKSYIHLQQHTAFIDFTPYNLPARNFSIISDITACKHDTILILTITKIHNNKETLVLQRKFNHEKTSVFTDREKEIILLTLKGNTSKEIADKLFISINTVRNHKQHMMQKTNTLNIVGLIDFYISNEVQH